MRKNKLGIIGGMGSLATVDFYKRIVEHTDAKKDQDHLDMIILNHASIIDRTYALKNNKEEELLNSLKEDIKILEQVGVSNIAIPCNTCHSIYDKIQSLTNIPIINMIEETVKYINNNKNQYKKIGLMATSGTIDAKIYQKYFNKYNLNLFIPDNDTQKEIMEIIYIDIKEKGIFNLEHFNHVLEIFKKNGCSHIILGCTELSGFKENYQDIAIDPMDCLVYASIEKTGGTYK